jgi:hypothetical protein
VQAQLDPLPARLAEVAEVAEPRLLRRDEEDVVVVLGAKESGVPRQPPRGPATVLCAGRMSREKGERHLGETLQSIIVALSRRAWVAPA